VLSILIPCYNNNVYSLVECLHREATNLTIPFEIIVQDDHSTNLFYNQEINNINHCSFQINTTNVGRSKNRNILLQQAQYSWVLLLDADVLPTSSSFLATYLHCLTTTQTDAIQGGVTYTNNSTQKHSLRWIYGKQREAISLIQRQINPYSNTLCSNILINREKITHLFDTSIALYGFEDLIFYKEIQKNNLKITAIDNTVEHLGLENNQLFVAKTEESCYNLAQLIAKHTLSYTDTKLSLYYFYLQHLRLCDLLSLGVFNLKKRLYNHLMGNSPSLIAFDIYKLLIYHQATKAIQKK
jgi:glycosyltransferase involved in cell wall biosynthesis